MQRDFLLNRQEQGRSGVRGQGGRAGQSQPYDSTRRGQSQGGPGGGAGSQNMQSSGQAQFIRVPVDTRERYRENSGESANLLIKEITAMHVQIYYDNTGQIIVPSATLQEAQDMGEPQRVFEKVPVKEILEQMSAVFVAQEATQQAGESPRNPYLVMEQFSVEARIFSYRSVDFVRLYSFLQQHLGSQNSAGGLHGGIRPPALRELMEQQFEFFQNEFSLKFALHPAPGCRNIVVNVTPDLVTTLHSLNEYIENYYIAQDLKQYRPQRKPITASQVRTMSKKLVKSESFKRKRRNVVRDWMYYIVWYVRLKRILDQHKASSTLLSPTSLLGGPAGGKGVPPLKSPIQDPTQLTTISFVLGLPSVQFKFFESNQKMLEFYAVSTQGHGSRAQEAARRPSPQQIAQRVAPLSLSVSGALISHSQNPLHQECERDLRIKGADVYLTKIQEKRSFDQRQDDLVERAGYELGTDGRAASSSVPFRGRGGRGAAGDLTRRGVDGAGRQMQGGQARQWEQQHSRVPSRGQQFSPNAGMFKPHKVGGQDFGLSQSGLYDQPGPSQPPAWGPQELVIGGNEVGGVHRQQQPYQEQSIWTSLFNAFKDLFNMNPSQEMELDATVPANQQHRDLMRSSSQARNSIHRGLGGGAAGLDSGSPHSAVKGRSSILQNAQLELTRVNRPDRSQNNHEAFPGQQRGRLGGPGGGAHNNRNPAHPRPSLHADNSGFAVGNGYMAGAGHEDDDLQGDSDADFTRQVLRHQCIRVDEGAGSQARRLFEVTQYPLLKTGSSEYSRNNPTSNDQVLMMTVKMTRLERLSLQCLVNRPVEATYCAQDIADVLLHQHGTVLQRYVSAVQKVTRCSVLREPGDENAAQGPGVIDFKPLWAIRRSMQRQKHRFLSPPESAYVSRVRPRKAAIRKERQMGAEDDDDDIDDEEGENIIDEDAELQNTLSYIECKPSISQSNRRTQEAPGLLPQSQRPTSMTQTMRSQLNLRSNAGLMSDQEDSIDGRHKSIGNEHRLAHKSISQRGRGGELVAGFSGQSAERGYPGLFDDKQLQEILRRYERSLGGHQAGRRGSASEAGGSQVNLQIFIDQPMYLHVLTGDGQARGAEYQPVCRLAIQPTQLLFSRSLRLSSFSAFGVEFESTNKIKVLQLFVHQLRDSMRSFLGNPIIQEHIQGQRIYQKLEALFKAKVYQKKKFNAVTFLDEPKGQDDLNARQMLGGSRAKQGQPLVGSTSEQPMQPGAPSRPGLAGKDSWSGPAGPNRINKQDPKPTIGAEEANRTNSECENTGSDGMSSLQQLPVQIKQVSQLNMQIIYNNIPGSQDEESQNNRKSDKLPNRRASDPQYAHGGKPLPTKPNPARPAKATGSSRP